MPHFPVSNSNLSAVHLGIFLQNQYLIPGNIHCRIIKAGINDTYIVDNGADRYVFRVYSLHWRTRNEIEEELRLLNTLKVQQIRISYPIPDKDHHFIQTLSAPEGERFGVLFSFAEGKKQHSFPADIHCKTGRLMAQLHSHTQGFQLQRVTYTPEILVTEPLEKIGLFLSADAPEMAYMQSLHQVLLQHLQHAASLDLTKGAVHLDIWFDNMNIDDNGEVTIFDFDFCGNGWLALDIAYYMLQLYNTEREEEECQNKLRHFLDGYTSIRAIPEEEQALLPALGTSIYFFYLGVQCSRYDNWSNTFLSESYLKRFITALVKRYADIHQLITI